MMERRGIPEKPTGSRWTDEQWRAIYERGGNLLLSAAAGSGKTAVLVERVIRALLDTQEPLDVDRLLILTFTKAADGEMRKRIRHALEEELMKNPYSQHLRKQLLLLPKASITTFHAFCLDLVKRYAYRLEIDPEFRILDESEEKLLQVEVLEEVLEEGYGDPSGAFDALADWFSDDRSDEPLQRLILSLYQFAISQPWPVMALERMVEMYRVAIRREIDEWPWTEEIKGEIGRKAAVLNELNRKAIRLCNLPGGPAEYRDRLVEEGEMLESLVRTIAANPSWEEIALAVSTVSFGRLPSIRRNDEDAAKMALKEEVQKLRDQVKKGVEELKTTYFEGNPEERKKELEKILPVVEELVRQVRRFAERYKERKRKKGVADFSDLEHKALLLLRDPSSTPAAEIPSETALELRDHYVEILVDEYQDTNEVQEAILSLLSGNKVRRFMVGDLKQSIYRFRQTEPRLFQEKYERYAPEGNEEGIRIDLAKNFRSRREILEGVNLLFRSIMMKGTAGMEYDSSVALSYGLGDEIEENPPRREDEEGRKEIEICLIDKESKASTEKDRQKEAGAGEGKESGSEEASEEENAEELELEELENAELEARLIGQKIKEMIGEGSAPRYLLYDRKEKKMRPVQFMDIVILFRSAQGWAPLFEDVFRQMGIPVYVERTGGYFSATEVQVLLSLLQLIDNPYQDIPLAAVLRSPIIGLTAEDMAQIGLSRRKSSASYYEALVSFAWGKEATREDLQDWEEGVKAEAEVPPTEEEGGAEEREALREKMRRFLAQLRRWRDRARKGALSKLVWEIYRETGYYDFVGGLPGGRERQANLQALYDRARLFEEGAFRGLYRFLRFVERMKERGEDLGTARALGEQEDVVRIMTIHKSKGLEFPIVFLAGSGKWFNEQDLRKRVIFSKDLGIGTDVIDLERSLRADSLPKIAIRERERREMLAEEMRLLYVALTRAKEKLIIAGTVDDYNNRTLTRWLERRGEDPHHLPAHHILAAKSYLDWIGPALFRPVTSKEEQKTVDGFSLQVISAKTLLGPSSRQDAEVRSEMWSHIRALEPIPLPLLKEFVSPSQEMDWKKIDSILSWKSPYTAMETHPAKQSVSEIKRKMQLFIEEEEGIPSLYLRRPRLSRRPRFMEEKGLTAAEMGTAMHTVMQHLRLDLPITAENLVTQIDEMVAKELLTPEQAKSIRVDGILRFFATRIGEKMLRADRVHREVPFTYRIYASRAYPDWEGEDEPILVQGMVDALIEEEGHLLLIDYKTDQTEGMSDTELISRYRLQISLYREAVESIWRRPVARSFLYFFQGERLLEV